MCMKRHYVAFLFLVLLFARPAQGETLIPTGSSWKYFIGTQEASSPTSAWRTNVFDDSSWLSGSAPIGYANPPNDPGGYEATIVTTLPNANPNTWLSVFFRKTFFISDPAQISQLDLTIIIDDGYVRSEEHTSELQSHSFISYAV